MLFIRCGTGQTSFIVILAHVPSSVTGVNGIAIILFDAIVVGVTLSWTLKSWRLHRRLSGYKITYVGLLVQRSK